MRVHNVIIITSGMSQQTDHQTFDQLVRDIAHAKKKPILVLGPDGDDFISRCEMIEDCELVFDPNYSGGFFSSVKAGLHATHGAAMIVALDQARPDTVERLVKLEAAVSGDGSTLDCELLYSANSTDVFLITVKGIARLRQYPATTEWPIVELSVETIDASNATKDATSDETPSGHPDRQPEPSA